VVDFTGYATTQEYSPALEHFVFNAVLVGPKAKTNLTAEGFGNSLKNVRPKLPLSNRINRNPNDQWVSRGRLDASDISLEVYGNGQDNSSTDAKDIGAAGSLNGSGLFHLSPYLSLREPFRFRLATCRSQILLARCDAYRCTANSKTKRRSLPLPIIVRHRRELE
jgi:hypothetical protein